MVVGRKQQTFTANGNAPFTPNAANTFAASRNLRKNQLGGVIFGCKNATYKECLFKQLFGLPVQQCEKMIQMEQKLVAAEMEIQRLKDRCMMLEPMFNHSTEHVNVQEIDPSEEMQLDPTKSIFLVGGYNVVQLNGEFYVFGGGDGFSWYDTVESYNPSTDQWTPRPSLKQPKGSLAGAALDDKIFAIGGGNGIQCFSDVEMLDLTVGRWINTRTMLQKRFALAAAELNGAIYATGGFDGSNYLKSAERFDPREHSWTKIAGMSTMRGCHSLVVSDQKLYAIGGFDGTEMVPSVEIFDPRLGSWMSGEPINQVRGYAAAAVVEGSIYVIGGLRAGKDIVDTVECFEAGGGHVWQVKTSKAVGKRCFMSAIVLKS